MAAILKQLKIDGFVEVNTLQDLIEHEPTTIRELERRDDAKDKVKFTESKLGVDCYAYSLPNDYNVLDDIVWELFNIRSDAFARQLGN